MLTFTSPSTTNIILAKKENYHLFKIIKFKTESVQNKWLSIGVMTYNVCNFYENTKLQTSTNTSVRRKNEKQKLNNEFNNIFTYKEERQ